MKKFLVIPLSLLLFLSFSLGMGCKRADKPSKAPKPAQSTNWKSMGTFNQEDFYLDFESLTYNGPIANFRYMHVDKEGEVDIARCLINCKEGTIVFRKHQVPDVDGKPLESSGDEELHWLKIQPNSTWVSFRKSLCKDFSQAEEKVAQEKALPIEEWKTKEVARLKVKPPKKPAVPGSERKTKEVARLKVKPPKKPAVPGSERKTKEVALFDKKPAQEKALPVEEGKTKEVARLKVKPPKKPAVPGSERKIYNRYTEVMGMPPSAAEGFIHTGRESRAWYEGSKISSPLTEKEVLAIENALAKTEVHNACIIANSIFSDDPDKTITKKDLKEKGFMPSEDIELAIYNGARASLKIAARHNKGTKIYMADHNCNITEETQH